MAQLKDSIVAGSLRVTDTIYGATAQLSAIKIPTTSGGNTLDSGSNGQIIMTNGTDVYWSSTATPSAHTHAAGDITSGTLSASRGGTGNTSLSAAASALINALDTGSSATQGDDYIVTQYAGGGTTNTTYYRRAAKNVRVGGLTTARALAVDLSSVSDGSYKFDGTADKTAIPITNTLGIGHGGTGTSTTPTQYGVIYASTTSAYASTGAGSSGQYLKSNGTSAPTWATFSPSTVGLGNVENTKLSTWTGSTYIKTVGTITSGTWNGDIITSSYIGSHNHAAGNITSGTLAIARGGTNASTEKGAKANLGLGTSAMDFGAGTFQGATQHWGIYAIVQESNIENTHKVFAGKNTALITKDNGLYMYNLTDGKSIWQVEMSTSNIIATLYKTPEESSPGESKASYKIVYKGNDSTAIGGLSTPVYVTANGEITAGTAIGAAGYKGVTNITSATNLGWTSNTNGATTVPTMNTIAYWNGAYSGTSSNLQYLGAVVNTKAADTSDIIVNGKSSHLYLKETHIIKGTTPSTQYWSAIEFNSADTTQPRLGLIEHTVDTSGNSQLNIFVVPNASGSTSWSGVILKKDTFNHLTITLQGPTTITADQTGATGTLTVAGGVITPAITTSDGSGLLAYKPTGWNGISNAQWGVGTINASGVIRSSDNNLIHYRAGTNYAILDTYNCLEYTRSSAFVGRNAEITANKNWYKVASCSISDANQDREMVLHVYDTMVTGAARSGILNVRVRTGSPLTSTTPALNLVWEYNNGFTSDQFKLVSNANTSPCVAELWTNVPYNWIGRVFTVIRMGTRITGQSNDWTLYKNYSVNDNGETGSTDSLTNSVTASYLDLYVGTISATYKMPAGGITYGIPFKNNDGNLAIASNLYWQDGGYTLRNQAPSGISPAFQVAGPTKAISLMINSADTNRGLYDTTIDNWAFKLDSDSNLTLNGGKSTNTDSTITLSPNNSSTTYGVKIKGYCAVALNIYAGEVSDTVERQTGARSKAGKICVYATGSATGDCGIYWWNNANTGRYIIQTAQDGTARFYGKADYTRDITNSGAIDFDYMKSGGYSVTPWTCVWVNSNNNGQGGLRVGAVSTLSVFGYGIIYSSTQPTVVNGKIWLKPV